MHSPTEEKLNKMTRSRSSLLPLLLLTTLVFMGGAANAQYEALSRVTNLSNVSSAQFENIKTDIVNSQFYEIKISGTIDTNGDSTNPAPWGISGSSVPFVVYIVIDAANPGTVTEDGFGNFGYTGDQIVAVYIRIGDEVAPAKETGYLNYPGLTTIFTGDVEEIDYFMDFAKVKVTLNDDLDGGSPTAANVKVLESSPFAEFRVGPYHVLSGTPVGGIFIAEGGRSSSADVSSVEVTDLSAHVIEFTGDKNAATNRRIAALQKQKKAKKKLKKAKKKKSANPKAYKKANKALKRAKKSYAASIVLATTVGVSEDEFLGQLGR